MFNDYAPFYDILNQNKPYKKEIEFVYKWAEKPKSIFDIGCGTGNYWDFFPEETMIIGIDKSHDMADRGRRILCKDVTKFTTKKRFDCATALFDVLNYIPRHDWWKNIPVEKGGFFIFDIWDKSKIDRDGFKKTWKEIGGVGRSITPSAYDGKSVNLLIEIFDDGGKLCEEKHRMYVYSDEDILRFCGKDFAIVETKATKTWQKWFKCKRK